MRLKLFIGILVVVLINVVFWVIDIVISDIFCEWGVGFLVCVDVYLMY